MRALLPLVGLLGCTPEPWVSHRGDQLVRLPVGSPAELRAAQALGDVWTEHPRGFVDVAVPWHALRSVPPEAEVRIDDLGRAIEASMVAAGPGVYDDWQDLEAIHDHMEDLAAAWPAAERVELGRSVEDRPIYGLRLGHGGYDGRRGTLITGALHAREWVAAHSALYAAEQLLLDDGVDPVVTALLAEEKVMVVPVANPDGYRYTWTTDRLWRKNRRDHGNGAFGVDLNRNFAVGWGGAGSSAVTTSDNYRGDAPLSEPEAAALADFLATHPRYDRQVDLHCIGQVVLHPWFHQVDPPTEVATLEALAVEAAGAVEARHGVPYDPGQAATRLYLASGTLIDHAHGRHGSSSLLFELRDRGHYGFLLPADQLLPTAEEAYEGLRAVLREPVRQLHLAVTREGAQGQATLQVHRAEGEVWIAASITGEGLHQPPDGPELQVDAPAVFGPFLASPTGVVTAAFRPPAAWAAGPVAWQAYTGTLRSPVVWTAR